MQVEDYSGNKTDPVKIPTADELAKCTVADPTQPDAKKSTLTAVDGSAVADGNAIGKGVTVEFTKVAVTPNKPGDQNKPGDTKPNKPSQNDNKNNDKNGASLSATGSSVIAIVAAMVVLLGAGAVVLRARSKTE